MGSATEATAAKGNHLGRLVREPPAPAEGIHHPSARRSPIRVLTAFGLSDTVLMFFRETFSKRHAIMWRNMRMVQNIEFPGIEPVRMEMTRQTWKSK